MIPLGLSLLMFVVAPIACAMRGSALRGLATAFVCVVVGAGCMALTFMAPSQGVAAFSELGGSVAVMALAAVGIAGTKKRAPAPRRAPLTRKR